MNTRYRLPSSDTVTDDSLEPVKAWLSDNGISLSLVPMGATLSVNEQRKTVSFFGYVRNSDGQVTFRRQGPGAGPIPVRRRMTFPISSLPPAAVGERVSG